MKSFINDTATNVQIILRHAEKFAYIDNHKKITADDIVLAFISYFWESDFSDSFFSVIWIKDRTHLLSYIEYYLLKMQNIDFTSLWVGEWELQFDEKLGKKIQKTKDFQSISEIELFDICFPLISPDLKKIFKLDHNCYQNIKTLIHNLSKFPALQEVWFLAFLEIIDNLVEEFFLDPSEITNMKIVAKSWKIDDILNNLESEIVEKEDNDNISLDTDSNKPKKKEEKKLTIEYFWTDLTKEARDGYLDPIIWREKEIDQVIYTLLRKTKNNPLLIWEAWVWKTAIVEWLQKMGKNVQKMQKNA